MSATEAGNSADAGSSSQSTPNEVPAGFERWRQSLARFTGMGLSDEERAERAKYDEQVKLATDWDRCEKWKSELMTRSEYGSVRLCASRSVSRASSNARPPIISMDEMTGENNQESESLTTLRPHDHLHAEATSVGGMRVPGVGDAVPPV